MELTAPHFYTHPSDLMAAVTGDYSGNMRSSRNARSIFYHGCGQVATMDEEAFIRTDRAGFNPWSFDSVLIYVIFC